MECFKKILRYVQANIIFSYTYILELDYTKLKKIQKEIQAPLTNIPSEIQITMLQNKKQLTEIALQRAEEEREQNIIAKALSQIWTVLSGLGAFGILSSKLSDSSKTLSELLGVGLFGIGIVIIIVAVSHIITGLIENYHYKRCKKFKLYLLAIENVLKTIYTPWC